MLVLGTDNDLGLLENELEVISEVDLVLAPWLVGVSELPVENVEGIEVLARVLAEVIVSLVAAS